MFYSNEAALADVIVDNHECKLKINEIEFQVVQRLHLRGFHNWQGSFDVIENKDRSGVAPLYTEPVTKKMALNFANIRYVVEAMKRKKKPGLFAGSEMIPRSPEEIFMLGQLSPATHSKHISNDYFLNVNVKFDGCTCCSSVPNISVPLTIIPLTNPETYGFVEPQGYNPIQLGYFKFNPIVVF